MDGNDLKHNSFLLKDRSKKTADVKKSKLEHFQTTVYLTILEDKFEVCEFVGKCITKAQKKKLLENYFMNSKTSKEYSCPSMFSNFWVLYIKKVFNK